MNNERRKRIGVIHDRLTAAVEKWEDLKSEVEELAGEEREAFDNLSEGLQQSDQGQRSEAAADALDEAVSSLESIIEYISETTTSLDTATE